MNKSEKEWLILVNEQNEAIGQAEKLEAHQKCLLHRAFSVLIFNSRGKMLIHQRALHKYHSPGLWTNACCSHPRPEESTPDAAHRRLKEELGFDTPIEEIASFVYKFYDPPSRLWEHEHDTVFMGQYDGSMTINTNEVAAIKWISIQELMQEIETVPQNFTYWFKLILKQAEVLRLIS